MAEIVLQNIAHSYNPQATDKTYALNPFNMTWVDGARYAILGPSGCGKSTMLNIMSGIVTPSEGKCHRSRFKIPITATAERDKPKIPINFDICYA